MQNSQNFYPDDWEFFRNEIFSWDGISHQKATSDIILYYYMIIWYTLPIAVGNSKDFLVIKLVSNPGISGVFKFESKMKSVFLSKPLNPEG